MYELTFKLLGMTCAACKKLSEKRIGSLDGVNTVSVDLSTGVARVTSESVLTSEQVRAGLADTPYEVVAEETA